MNWLFTHSSFAFSYAPETVFSRGEIRQKCWSRDIPFLQKDRGRSRHEQHGRLDACHTLEHKIRRETKHPPWPQYLHFCGDSDVEHWQEIDKSVGEIVPQHIQCLSQPPHVGPGTGIKGGVRSVTGVGADIIVTHPDGDHLPSLPVSRVVQYLHQGFGLFY